MFKTILKPLARISFLSFLSLNILFPFNASAEATTNNLPSGELEYKEKANALLKTLDGNKDNKLSPNEVNLSFRLRRFQYVDKNQDGYLDEIELTDSYRKSALYQAQKNSQNGGNKPFLEQIVQKISPPINSNNQVVNSSTVNLTPTNINIKDSGLRYTVEPGDSLFSIAKRYNIVNQDLMKINQIDDATKLPVSKVLIIPASQKTINP